MQTLRCFLMVWQEGRDWQITIHRELEDLVATWNSYPRALDATGVIHIGFSRPDTRSFASYAAAHEGRVLLTGSARYGLGGLGRCLPQPVGDVEGIPLFLSCEGWGYTIPVEPLTDTMAVSQKSLFPADQVEAEAGSKEEWLLHLERRITPHLTGKREKWLNAILAEDPMLAAAVADAGIFDDQSYQRKEAGLAAIHRITLGVRRFEYLTSSLSNVDAGSLARCLPPWFIETAVSALGLGVRAGNCLRAADISTVADLRFFAPEALRKLPNFGRKCDNEVAQRLKASFDADVTLRLSEANRLARPIEASRLEPTSPSFDPVAPSAYFLDELAASLPRLKWGRDVVLRRRMGLRCEAATLQEIAEDVGVTRERIRQIERAAKLEIQHLPIWRLLDSNLSMSLSKALEPLPVLGLDVVLPWLDGIAANAKVLSYCFDNFLDGRFHLVEIEHIEYVTRLSQDEWDLAMRQASEIMAEAASKNWPVSQAQSLVSGLLPFSGSEFSEELWRLAVAKAHTATIGAGEPVVVAYGTSMEAMVLGVLSESERPLHFLEVAERLRGRDGGNNRARYVHAACGRYAFLYGRGTFGLRKHFPLDAEEEEALVQETLAIVGEGKAKRQWHCNELVEHLYANGVDCNGNLDPYVLCIALQNSNTLTYLGRMVWVHNKGQQMSTANRIDIRQAILSVIQNAGCPLSYKEIRERIVAERGINDIFQIFDGGNLLRLGSGRWGLLDRDLGLSEAEISEILDRLATELEDRGIGLHTSELLPYAGLAAERFDLLGGGSVMLAIATRDQRFRSGAGQYLYLSKWEGPRRLLLVDAVREILLGCERGASIQTIVVKASEMMGRDIARDGVYGGLRNLGAVWAEDTACWSIPSESPTAEGDLTSEPSICP